ncbi:MAG: hypothetical protein MZV63_33955, partial [Marinilabiliales bacterium]|nr:hypothetical protein [Marinilabiliales bacterium]
LLRIAKVNLVTGTQDSSTCLGVVLRDGRHPRLDAVHAGLGQHRRQLDLLLRGELHPGLLLAVPQADIVVELDALGEARSPCVTSRR